MCPSFINITRMPRLIMTFVVLSIINVLMLPAYAEHIYVYGTGESYRKVEYKKNMTIRSLWEHVEPEKLFHLREHGFFSYVNRGTVSIYGNEFVKTIHSANFNPQQVSSIKISKGTDSVYIDDEKICCHVALYLCNSERNLNKKLINLPTSDAGLFLQVKLKLKDGQSYIYMYRYEEDNADYQMLLHILYGYDSSHCNCIEVCLKDIPVKSSVTDASCIYIAKEKINDGYLYSAYIRPDYLNSIVIYRRISDKYDSLSKLLDTDANLLKIRHAAIWSFPPDYVWYEQLNNHVPLNSKEETEIVDDVINHKLNINQGWYLLKSFYDFYDR